MRFFTIFKEKVIFWNAKRLLEFIFHVNKTLPTLTYYYQIREVNGVIGMQ